MVSLIEYRGEGRNYDGYFLVLGGNKYLFRKVEHLEQFIAQHWRNTGEDLVADDNDYFIHEWSDGTYSEVHAHVWSDDDEF